MVERIRRILEVRQLSPTQFADAIGVARPIVSHILSGRNKPSLEVVQKIIAAFPELSLPWLLSGGGEMLAVAAAGSAGPTPELMRPPEAVAAPKKPRIAAPLPPEPGPVVAAAPQQLPLDLAAGPAPQEIQVPSEPAAVVPPAPSALPAAPVGPVPAATPAPATAEASALELAASLGEPGKAIRRIVIFYHDGTFAAYQPE